MPNSIEQASSEHKTSNRSSFRIRDKIAIAVTLVMACAAFVILRGMRDAARLASCRPDMIGLFARYYVEDHDGMFPPLSPTPGRLMFTEGSEQRIVADAGRRDFTCEFDLQDRRHVTEVPNAPVDDWSYVYLGYVIENQAQLERFAEAYEVIVSAGGDFTQDIKVDPGEGNCGTDTIFRLRDRTMLLKLLPCLEGRLEEIPLVIEWPENHRGPVAKVVSLAPGFRGKVMKYPGEWPMTEEAIGVLRELDALGGVE